MSGPCMTSIRVKNQRKTDTHQKWQTSGDSKTRVHRGYRASGMKELAVVAAAAAAHTA